MQLSWLNDSYRADLLSISEWRTMVNSSGKDAFSNTKLQQSRPMSGNLFGKTARELPHESFEIQENVQLFDAEKPRVRTCGAVNSAAAVTWAADWYKLRLDREGGSIFQYVCLQKCIFRPQNAFLSPYILRE